MSDEGIRIRPGEIRAFPLPAGVTPADIESGKVRYVIQARCGCGRELIQKSTYVWACPKYIRWLRPRHARLVMGEFFFRDPGGPCH